MAESPRGQPIPDTVEAWKNHAYLMADKVEEQRDEINNLKQRANQLRQRVDILEGRCRGYMRTLRLG